MSPEQVSGEPFDHRADIFSLGVVLYEMLTGVTPFAGDDITQLMFQVVNAAVVPPSHVNRALPPVLDYILARALKKKPEERYGSAAEFATDLRDAIPDVLAAEAAVHRACPRPPAATRCRNSPARASCRAARRPSTAATRSWSFGPRRASRMRNPNIRCANQVPISAPTTCDNM